jgi:hypothetical protein
MRAAVESLDVQRERADAVERAIARIDDRTRRVELLASLYDARTVLKEAVAGVHEFAVPAMQERIAAAARRLDALVALLPPTAR